MTTLEERKHALMYGQRIAPSKLGSYPRPTVTYPFGPAGVPIPPSAAIYRKTQDGELLSKIVRKAFGAWAAVQLPEAEWDATAALLAADIDQRRPPADMEVLARYGFAKPVELAYVDLRGAVTYKPVCLQLPAPRTVMHLGTHFVADLIKSPPSQHAHVPAETMDFFRRWNEVARAERDQFTKASQWPGQFRVHNGRWPRWAEIEAEWPRIGEWLRDQRKQVAA